MTGAILLSDNTVVVFTNNNARLLLNPENLSAYEAMPNAVINPDLSGVLRLPPHFWKLKDGKVVKLEDSDITLRIADIGQRDAINTYLVGTGIEPDPKPVSLRIPLYLICYTCAVVLITLIVKGCS